MKNSISGNEKILLANLVTEIKKAAKWKDAEADWTNRDYIKLNEDILEVTQVNISVSTLRRLFQLSFVTLPNTSTLHALAKYIGFDDWNHFVEKKNFRKPKNFKNSALYIGALLVLGIIGLVSISLMSSDKQEGFLELVNINPVGE